MLLSDKIFSCFGTKPFQSWHKYTSLLEHNYLPFCSKQPLFINIVHLVQNQFTYGTNPLLFWYKTHTKSPSLQPSFVWYATTSLYITISFFYEPLLFGTKPFLLRQNHRLSTSIFHFIQNHFSFGAKPSLFSSFV